MSGATLDLATTAMQETGECTITGLSWADIYTVLDRLGIDPARTSVSGGRLIYLDKPSRPPP